MVILGFLVDLASSLGDDATLNDILQMLNKHYGMVITFDVLSKDPYSLKQGLGGEHGWIQSAVVAAGPDTPARVSGKDLTGVHRGDEVRSLLPWPEPQIPINIGL